MHCHDPPQQLRPVAKNTAAKYRRAALVATVGPDRNFSAGTVCSRRETAVADFIVIAYRNISVDRLDHGSRKQRISATQYHLRPRACVDADAGMENIPVPKRHPFADQSREGIKQEIVAKALQQLICRKKARLCPHGVQSSRVRISLA